MARNSAGKRPTAEPLPEPKRPRNILDRLRLEKYRQNQQQTFFPDENQSVEVPQDDSSDYGSIPDAELLDLELPNAEPIITNVATSGTLINSGQSLDYGFPTSSSIPDPDLWVETDPLTAVQQSMDHDQQYLLDDDDYSPVDVVMPSSPILAVSPEGVGYSDHEKEDYGDFEDLGDIIAEDLLSSPPAPTAAPTKPTEKTSKPFVPPKQIHAPDPQPVPFVSTKRLPSIDSNSDVAQRMYRYLNGLPLDPPAIEPDILHGHPPFARTPFPEAVEARNYVGGLNPANRVRVCFRVGEVIKVINGLGGNSLGGMVEFYGRLNFSERNDRQTLQLDLFHSRPPYLTAIYHGYKTSSLGNADSSALLQAEAKGMILRVIGRAYKIPPARKMDEEGKSCLPVYRIEAESVREADWEEVEWVLGCVGGRV